MQLKFVTAVALAIGVAKAQSWGQDPPVGTDTSSWGPNDPMPGRDKSSWAPEDQKEDMWGNKDAWKDKDTDLFEDPFDGPMDGENKETWGPA